LYIIIRSKYTNIDAAQKCISNFNERLVKMFFSINTLGNDSRFSNNYNHNDVYIGLDNGWEHIFLEDTLVFYKGYCDSADLKDIIECFIDDKTPRLSGNFCVIVVEKNSTTVTHDLTRSFPLYSSNTNVITNLPYDNVKLDTVYSDRYLSIIDNSVTEHFFDRNLSVANIAITTENFLKNAIEILKNKTLALKNKNTKIFLTGGVNTMLCYALLTKYLNDEDFELITYEHLDYDEFIYKNFSTIKQNFWGYSQIHHWKTPSILASGAFGDEYFMRGPETAALWAAWHDVDILALTKTRPPGYHYAYFLKDKNKKIFQKYWNNRHSLKEQYLLESDLNNQILDMLCNDHQHWHLGNTITWTPLKDLDITKMILQLPPEDIIDQILDAKLDFMLISQLENQLLKYVSKQKNTDTFEHLINFGNLDG